VGNFPFITSRFPTYSDGEVTTAYPQIIFNWNNNVVSTQFSDPTQLEKFVVLLQKDTGDQVPVQYVNYDNVLKQVIVQPVSGLWFGETYIVLVNSGIKDILNRYSQESYRWEFTLSPCPIGKVDTVSPTDWSLLNIFPSFQFWAVSVTGLVNYELQVDTRFDFANPVYRQVFQFTQTDYPVLLAVTPAGYFPSETTYYWRIQASSNSVSGWIWGDWSCTKSFYFGTSQVAHPNTISAWTDPLPFQLTNIGWKNGLSNQPNYPTISVTFNEVINQPNFTFMYKSMLPRNDQANTYIDQPVAGTWSTGPASSFIFTPASAILKNTRYELTVPASTADMYGVTLNTPSDLVYYFTSQYDPFYVSTREIRSRFMGSDADIPDDLINYYIYIASLEAKSRYWSTAIYPSLDTYLGDGLKEQYIRDSPDLNSYGLLKWTAAATTYLMIQNILRREMFNIGRERTFDGNTVKVTKDFLAALIEAKKDAQLELNAYSEQLTSEGHSVSVSPSTLWSSANYFSDWQAEGISGRIGSLGDGMNTSGYFGGRNHY